MSRTSVDLINELKSEGDKSQRAALIIRFAKHIEYVHMDNPHSIDVLNEMVLRNGEPVGLFTISGGVVRLRPLKEHMNQQSVSQLLSKLSPEIQTRLRIFGNQGFSL